MCVLKTIRSEDFTLTFRGPVRVNSPLGCVKLGTNPAVGGNHHGGYS